MADDTRSEYPFEELIARLGAFDKPRDVMVATCRELAKTTDFCCFMRLSGRKATGRIFYSRPPLPDYDIERFTLDIADERLFARLVDDRVPLDLSEADHPQRREIAERRNVECGPALLFPVGVGDRVPFAIYLERPEAFSAPERGHIASLLSRVGMRLMALVLERKRASRKKKGPTFTPKTPVKRPSARIGGLNWAGEYSSSERRDSHRSSRVMPKITPISQIAPDIKTAADIQDELALESMDDLNRGDTPSDK